VLTLGNLLYLLYRIVVQVNQIDLWFFIYLLTIAFIEKGEEDLSL
jgi:hypothetical protein